MRLSYVLCCFIKSTLRKQLNHLFASNRLDQPFSGFRPQTSFTLDPAGSDVVKWWTIFELQQMLFDHNNALHCLCTVINYLVAFLFLILLFISATTCKCDFRCNKFTFVSFLIYFKVQISLLHILVYAFSPYCQWCIDSVMGGGVIVYPLSL